MVTVLSKKYAKALCELQSMEILKVTLDSLNRLTMALDDSGLEDFLAAKEITAEKKVSLLCEISKNNDTQFRNFISLLIEKKRVELISVIAEEIRRFIAVQLGVHKAKVVANFDISDSQLHDIQQAMCNKLAKTVILEFEKVTKDTFNGIKVEIDDLGIEVEIDKWRIKNSLVEHILSSSKI